LIPKYIFIEPTSICNLNCKFCVSNLRENNGIMPNELFYEAVSQTIDYGIPHIDISPFTGEIFTDPDILKKIDILEESDIKSWSFFTNLTLINNSILEKLYNSKKLTIISLSINGEDYESFNYLTGGNKELFDNVIINLERIFKIKNVKINLYLKFLNLNYKFYWHKKEISNLIFRNSSRVTLLIQQNFIDDWCGYIKEGVFGRTLVVKNHINNKQCHVLSDKNMIHWNGDFHLCGCRDFTRETFVENIKNLTIKEMYNGEKVKSIIHSWKTICQSCGHKR